MRSLLIATLTTAVVLLTQPGMSLGTGSGADSASGDGVGGGSHAHMRQQHRHTTGEGENHRHHVPQRAKEQDSDVQRDPKRPLPKITNPKLLQDSKLIHDREHLKEELPKYLDPEKIKNMSQRELDYHYFKIHDFDNNRKLDGLELMKALGHVHGHGDDHEEDEEDKYKKLTPEEKQILKNLQRQKQEEDWKYYIELVDEVMEDNDKNEDGFLSYAEYIYGRNRNYGQQEYVDNLE